MTESDLPAVLKIQASCYPPQYLEGLSAFSAKLALNPTGCWVVCMDQNLQGYLVTMPAGDHHLAPLNAQAIPAPEQPTMLYLHDLALTSEARGLGLPGHLLTYALDHARSRALDTMALIAVQGTERFWARHGFQPTMPSPQLLDTLRTYGDAQFMTRSTSSPSEAS